MAPPSLNFNQLPEISLNTVEVLSVHFSTACPRSQGKLDIPADSVRIGADLAVHCRAAIEIFMNFYLVQ